MARELGGGVGYVGGRGWWVVERRDGWSLLGGGVGNLLALAITMSCGLPVACGPSSHGLLVAFVGFPRVAGQAELQRNGIGDGRLMMVCCLANSQRCRPRTKSIEIVSTSASASATTTLTTLLYCVSTGVGRHVVVVRVKMRSRRLFSLIGHQPSQFSIMSLILFRRRLS